MRNEKSECVGWSVWGGVSVGWSVWDEWSECGVECVG